MKTQKCRVCGAEVGLFGWNMHCEKHKREFCRAIGHGEQEAWRINWEDVVLYFKPKNADKKKCVGYQKRHDATRLTDYTN